MDSDGQAPPAESGNGDDVPPHTPDNDRQLDYFIGLLSDDNEGTRWKAAESLGRIRDPRAVEPLIDTLWDDDARVRLKVAWALGMLGDPRALRPLQRLYRIERENAREIIQEAMELIKQAMSGNNGVTSA
jgi:HEAT repeat protein